MVITGEYFAMWQSKIWNGQDAAFRIAGGDLDDSAATDHWQAAGWLGMTLEQLEEGCGHHHPDFLEVVLVDLGLLCLMRSACAARYSWYPSKLQGRPLETSDGNTRREEWPMRVVKTVSQVILLFGLIVAPCLAIAAEPTFKEGWFTTNDGVKLHYLEAGSGSPLVMIPGWSQSAMEFKYQLTGLSDKYHVYALDMRGHGDSAKPDHGYRIQRLSADVHEFLVGNNLGAVTLAGHSMGCSVIWGYWEQYGSDRLSKLILVDQMPMITSNPAWSPKELEDAGAIFDGKSLFDNVNALAGPEGVKTTEGFIRGMFTKQYPMDAVDWVIQENLKFPREYAARLLFDHATNDWRDLIPAINIPTLVVGGKASLVPWKSQVWVGSQIRGAQTEIFEENEGGAHFMFMENPAKFNRLVKAFNG
jgi:non-heme chloroperoxidase